MLEGVEGKHLALRCNRPCDSMSLELANEKPSRLSPKTGDIPDPESGVKL